LTLNTLVQVGGRLVGLIAGVGASVVLGRYLGPETYGAYVYVITFLGFFAVLTSFGLDAVALRDLAGETAPIDDVLSSLVSVRLLLTLAVVPIALLAVMASETSTSTFELAAVIAPVLFASPVASVGILFSARLR